MTFFTPILIIHKALHRVCERVSRWYWQNYAVAYLSYKGAQFSRCKFYGRCRLHIAKGGRINLGKQFVCRSGAEYAIDNCPMSKITVRSKGRLQIGACSGMSNTVIVCSDSITIGDYVKIGTGCLVMDSNFHSTDWRTRMTADDTKDAKTAPIVVGDGVFIGARSIICKGVTIGEHSMIAAGSVVVKDIPANCLAGGNPCKVIRML